jgi:hypothetical protein
MAAKSKARNALSAQWGKKRKKQFLFLQEFKDFFIPGAQKCKQD